MVVAIMTVTMICNSLRTDTLLIRHMICPVFRRFHVLAVHALIRVKADAPFLWEEKSGKLNRSPKSFRGKNSD